jgi:anti-sigma B factor antagonist
MATLVANIGGVHVLRIEGELDATAARSLRREAERLLNVDERDYVVDMAEVTRIDSAGLESLTWLLARSEERLGTVKLAGASPTIRSILRVTRLDTRFELHEFVDGALASFG